MRLLFLLIAGILAIFPLYPNDPNENDVIEQPKPDKPKKTSRKSTLTLLPSINLGYSYGRGNSIIAGLNLTMANDETIFPFLQTFGLEYQCLVIDNNVQSIIRADYTYTRYVLFFGEGIGISFFYNINNNDIGIAPKIGITLLVPDLPIILNYYFRYNFVLNNINNGYYENTFFVSVYIH